MDIWAWVGERQNEYWESDPEFAILIDEFPSWVVDQEDEKVESNLPVALQKCKSYDDSWLEVYFRHWYMQLKVFKQQTIKHIETEVVDLLNFAHKEGTIDCPQSVCVVQDFCSFYAKKDGPSYVEERKKISGETLERITPEWACFGCITGEYFNALLDEGRNQDAFEFIKKQREQMRDKGTLAVSLASAYVNIERYDEAIKLLKQYSYEYSGLTFRNWRNLHLALAYGHVGEIDKALETLPKFETLSRANYKLWIDIQFLLAEKGGPPVTQNKLDEFETMAWDYHQNGVYRKSFDIFKRLYKHYHGNGDLEKGEEMITALRNVAQDLRYPDKAELEIRELVG